MDTFYSDWRRLFNNARVYFDADSRERQSADHLQQLLQTQLLQGAQDAALPGLDDLLAYPSAPYPIEPLDIAVETTES